MPGRPWTDAERLFLRNNLAQRGARYCAAHLGRTPRAVRVYAHRKLRTARRAPLLPRMDREAPALYAKGWTDPMMARHFGCTVQHVWYWRQGKGLPAVAPNGSAERRMYHLGTAEETMAAIRRHNGNVADILADLGVTRKALRLRLRRMGSSITRLHELVREGHDDAI